MEEGGMKRGIFATDRRGISAMQDAILFCVMVSLSGAILLPALTHDAIPKSQIERERNEVANEALLVLLSTTRDEFSYRLADTITNNALGNSSIPILESSFSDEILEWLLGRTQYHKTYGNLIAENLACQLLFPIENHDVRINLLTGGFDTELREGISQQLDMILEGKYHYNFSATWYPIIGVPFGGRISAGSPPPTKVYVAKTWITMPYSPKMELPGLGPVTLTRGWLESQIEEASPFENLTNLLTTDLETAWQEFEENLIQNLTYLLNGFLFTGLRNDTGVVVFPGVVNITLHYIFEKLMGLVSAAAGVIEEKVSESMGSAIGSLNGMFGQQATGAITGIVGFFINLTVDAVYNFLGIEKTYEGVNISRLITDIVGYFVSGIIDGTLTFLSNMLTEYVESFAHSIFDMLHVGELVGQAERVREMIYNWIFARVSLSKAEVTLMIWRA